MRRPSHARLAVAVCLTTLVLNASGGAFAAQQQFDPDDYFSTMQWRNIGPTRGGRSVAVAGNVADPRTYYFGGAGGGVWKTTDAGGSWHNVSDGFMNTGSVGAIAVSESDPNVVYVGMGEHAVRGVTTSHGDGVYKSTDGGRTWVHLGLDRSRAISRIRVHPRDPDLVYVAVQGAPYAWTEDRGIYRSEDGGVTWEKIHYVSEQAGASDLSMDMNNPRILYAAYWQHIRRPWVVESGGADSGLWKSNDGGATWARIESGLPELMGKVSVDVSRANSERVFAIVEAADGEGGLYRSDDGGAHWEHLNSERILQARSWYYMEVFADPQDANTVIVLNAPFLRSVDGGKTFEPVEVPHGDNHDLWINPTDNDVMINANDGGANISFDGARSWSTQQNQPTAQFYRVITDNQFPYHVYGGQQDNSAIGIASAVFGSIGWKDFYEVSGCESAYLAFDDRDDPQRVYGTCIEGDIDVWDRRSGERKPIRAYPELGLGVNPIDQKYRFNWNNPVIGSRHRTGVVYQAGNVLFRTSDGGQSWTVVSPDLTHNDPEKQAVGGFPITNENAGGEVYNTIFYVAESPVVEGVLWAGTDDGLVQLSRDGGTTWNDVTPPDLRDLGRGGEAPGEAIINSIEASPHDPGRAYVVVTRYKFNDFTPLIFRTEDYGASWTSVTDGIGTEAWVRVVREDPAREGLLFAGTELGLYISFDAGAMWQPWQLNLPIVPITDLTVHDSDLVAATQGRAFWILDDLSPVRQLHADAPAQPIQLLASRTTVMVDWGETSGVGANPPSGAQIYFHLDAEPEDLVRVEILAPTGELVRTMATDPKAAGNAEYSEIEASKGLNRVVWDLRNEPVIEVPEVMNFGSFNGHLVPPGDYTVRLTVADVVRTAPLRLAASPWRTATADQYAKQDEFLADTAQLLTDMSASVNRLWSARSQLQQLAERIVDRDGVDELRQQVEALVESIEAWDGDIVQRQQKTFQDVINFENQLMAQVLALSGSVDGVEPPVTTGARQRLADLQELWRTSHADADELEGQIEEVNVAVHDAGVGGILLPSRSER